MQVEDANKAFYYVVSANKPTSVTHSLVGHFTGPDDLNLILCKGTLLEIYLVGEDSVQQIYDVGLYGRVATMSLFRLKGDKQDSLFISTERMKFCVLSYNAEKAEIGTRANGNLLDLSGRQTQIGQIGIIDPEGNMIGMHLYDGLFKVIPIDQKGQLQEAYDVRLEELMILDIKFLYGCPQPTLVVLYQDTKEARHIKTYQISLQQKDIKEYTLALPNIQDGAEFVIPLPMPYGGVLVLGLQSILYFNGTVQKSLNIKCAKMKAYGFIDPSGERILLGDELGGLHVLIVENNKVKVTGLKLEHIGDTSCASNLTYLDKGMVYVGSRVGDSQLIKLLTEKDEETGQYFEVLDVYPNLGPIVDFCVVDLERQGQGQIVTCSGAFKDGSLRIVRNGIGISEHAQLDLAGIKGIWSLDPPAGSKAEKYLIMSFVGETRVLAMEGEELEEVELEGFQMDLQTNYCGNMVNGHYLQVTTTSVNLISAEAQKLVATWQPPNNEKINVSACNTCQVAIASGGSNLTVLEISGSEFKVLGTKKLPHEISCLNINPVGISEAPEAMFCAVGLWNDISVLLFSLPDLTQVAKIDLSAEVVPRSVLLTTFEHITYVMIGFGDGNLIHFEYDLQTGELDQKKKVSLGTQPIKLSTFMSNARPQVFCCSDQPAVINQSTNKKLLYSNVNLKEVSYMCDFNCASFPDSLALATESSLTIGTVDQVQKLHIRNVPLGEMPRRICHQPALKSYCVLTVKTESNYLPDDKTANFVKLFDDQTFEVQDSYALQPFEAACSVVQTNFKTSENYFVVGTAFVLPEDPEPTKGRILVFSVTDGKFRLQAETPVDGAVYCLNSFNGKILAGINSKVELFGWNSSGDGVTELKLEADHKGHILALYLASKGDFIVVGDLMRSVTLLLFNPEDGSIKEIARDLHPNWMTAVDIWDHDNFIGSENGFNIFTVARNSGAINPEERAKLDVTGEFHFGEFINAFRHGTLQKVAFGPAVQLPSVVLPSVDDA